MWNIYSHHTVFITAVLCVLLQYSMYYCSTVCITAVQYVLLQYSVYYCSTACITAEQRVLLQYSVYYCSTICITAVKHALLQYSVYYCSRGYCRSERIKSDSIRLNLIISLKSIQPPSADKHCSGYCRTSSSSSSSAYLVSMVTPFL